MICFSYKSLVGNYNLYMCNLIDSIITGFELFIMKNWNIIKLNQTVGK